MTTEWPEAFGEMAERIRVYRWDETALGPKHCWPERLRHTVDLMLAMPFPALLNWGPDLLQIYNDAAISMFGYRHPAALGRSLFENFSESEDILKRASDRLLRTGDSFVYDDQPFTLPNLSGDPVIRRFSGGWTPIKDDGGQILGILASGMETTERVRSEVSARAGEERYLGVYNASMQGFCTIEVAFDQAERPTDYRFLEVGPSFEAQTGIKDAAGRWMRDIAADQDRLWFEAYGRVALTGEPARFEAGSAPLGRWWSVYAYRIGEPAQRTIAVVFSDITPRKRAEEALRASEERLRQFGEASQDILWIRDAENFQWTYLTPAFEAIYGLDLPSALRGDNMATWTNLIVPEDRDLAVTSIQRVRSGERVTFEYRIRRPVDGQIRWLRNTDFPIVNAEGRVVSIGGIGQDITALKRSADALAAAEQRQRALLEGIPQMVWRAADSGSWTWASPQWTRYTGQGEADSHGWGWLMPLHPDDREIAQDAWEQAVETGGFAVEYRIRQADRGTYRWFQTRATPVHDASGAVTEWLGTSTDIHDLRKLQESQKVLVAELQHRTRNLIAVIRSTSDKTARASVNLNEFRVAFRYRLDALARVQGLLSRLEEQDRISFDELIGAEIQALNGAADRIMLSGPPGIRLRSSMVQTLAMALHELATNAVKYGALGQPQGHLVVSWVLIRDAPDNKPWLHIDWRESGVAMPPADACAGGGGQGRALIERALPYQLGAKTTYLLGPDGVHCTITVPISANQGAEGNSHDRLLAE